MRRENNDARDPRHVLLYTFFLFNEAAELFNHPPSIVRYSIDRSPRHICPAYHDTHLLFPIAPVTDGTRETGSPANAADLQNAFEEFFSSGKREFVELIRAPARGETKKRGPSGPEIVPVREDKGGGGEAVERWLQDSSAKRYEEHLARPRVGIELYAGG